MNWFYERNDELLNSPVNKTFEELLWTTDDEFRQWVIDMRKEVVRLWDDKGIPPRVGFNKDGIIDNFQKMVSFPVHEFETLDLRTGEKDVVRNTSVVGNAVNQWFPTMMKTGISYTTKGKAKSIYDYFADDAYLDTFVTYASRHFKRDSFYHYSSPISVDDIVKVGNSTFKVETPEQFVGVMEHLNGNGWDYWLCPVKEDKVYTGYSATLGKKQNVIVDYDFAMSVPERCRTNVSKERSNAYSIRLFKLGQKVFPLGLKSFRVSFCQYAVNFPPLTARYLYERFTDHIKDQKQINIWDPSSGWAGRIVGAMSVNDKRNIHYIGTDPNTDHNTTSGRTKYHEVADFFNDHVRESGSLFPKSHTYEIFQCGSEVAQFQKGFQKYKGKLDLVFTSPPYFAKEVYSDDPEQSCHKFSEYSDWVEGFLRPTLETAVEYLRKDRYLLWNIADAAFDGKLLTLEEDSCRILKELGMEYVTTLKMALAQMPGGNRMSDTGETITTVNALTGEETTETVLEGKMKNFCQIENNSKKIMLKYEPVFVFRKVK